MRYLFIFLTFLFGLTSCAQADRDTVAFFAPTVETYQYPLGDQTINIKKSMYGQQSHFVFVQLHHNEATAEQTAIDFLQQAGGVLISLENGGSRNITFSLKNKRYTFDPNRMFTLSGISSSLKLYSTYTEQAATEINELARYLEQLIPDTAVVIALHNNTDNRYSVLSYRQKHYQKDVLALHINKAADRDNFFITTHQEVYNELRQMDYNVVLQNNETVTDDGSLSVLLGKQNKQYINVEAQFGHFDEQRKMIAALMQIIGPRMDVATTP